MRDVNGRSSKKMKMFGKINTIMESTLLKELQCWSQL